MKRKFMSNEVGTCPVCNRLNLKWGNTDFSDNYVSYEYECESCGVKGVEYYKLIFDGHDIYDKETDEWVSVDNYM